MGSARFLPGARETPILRPTLRCESAESAGVFAPHRREPRGPAARPGVRRGESRMDLEPTLSAAIPGEPTAVGQTGRHTENALLGWILVVGLTLVGFVLLALGASHGGPG